MVKHNHVILTIGFMHANQQKMQTRGSDIFLLHLFQLSS